MIPGARLVLVQWWHWVVFALLLGVILLVGVFLSAIFEDVGEGIQTYTRAQRQKLAHLPMYGLVTGEPVMGDAIYGVCTMGTAGL